MPIETVKIKSANPEHEQGFIVINKSDFDPNTHELWQEDLKHADQAKAGARGEKLHLKG